jgi:allantoinase
MAIGFPRDLVGYGGNPPHPHWPGEARIAVNFVMNYEEGSEYNAHDDGFSEGTLTEAGAASYGVKGRDLAAEGMFEYGSRVGFWRVHRLFRERNLPLTVFGCALALERNPPVAAAIRESGWDVCSHGWRWVKHYELAEAEEREHIRKAIESMKKTVGERPLGWYCRYGPSVNTRRLVVEEGGFLYDSDAYNDELPYYLLDVGHARLERLEPLAVVARALGAHRPDRGEAAVALVRLDLGIGQDLGHAGGPDPGLRRWRPSGRRAACARPRPWRPGRNRA